MGHGMLVCDERERNVQEACRSGRGAADSYGDLVDVDPEESFVATLRHTATELCTAGEPCSAESNERTYRSRRYQRPSLTFREYRLERRRCWLRGPGLTVSPQ